MMRWRAGLFRAWPAALLIGLASAIPAASLAQVSDPGTQSLSNVWTIDPDRLYAETTLGKRIRADLEIRAGELARENRRIEAELTAEERDLTERRAALSVAEFRVLADAFDAKVDQIRAEQDAKARDIQRLQESGQQSFFAQVVPVLSVIMRERGSAILLDRRSVFLSLETTDLTDQAIARIDQVLGEGERAGEGSGETAGEPAGETAGETAGNGN
jgi:Skp family chaperone for outer membrane proteins